MHAKHLHTMPTSTVIFVLAEIVTISITFVITCIIDVVPNMMNTCTYNSQSHDHYIVQNWRKSSHRAHKDFSQDGFIEDNSNEVFLQCHSLSDDEETSDNEQEMEDHFDNDGGHGQEFILW